MKDQDQHWPVVDVKHLYKVRSLQMQNDAIAMILDGKEDVVKVISDKYNITLPNASNIVDKARRQITSRKDYEVDSIIELHLGRYEEIYAKLVEMRFHGIAATALKAKEKILQFHKNSTHMKVTNNTINQISVYDVKHDYDIDRLEPQQRDRFKELLDRAMR